MLNKYTDEEIERIFTERVRYILYKPQLKAGLIAEWTFTYPTGYRTAEVACAFPMNEEDHDEAKAWDLIREKIKDKVWEICGKYTLATGDKL